MSLLYARGTARIDSNLTPLIDLAFLLIVFFILVTRMSGEQTPPINLPQPGHPAMTPARAQPRLTVNLMVEGDKTVVSLGSRRFAPGDAGQRDLTLAIAQRIRLDPALPVDVRADRSLRYAAVEPTLHAIAQAATQAGLGHLTVRVCALEVKGVAHE